ncbi:MAG: helix-turn-helix domain-containing protein [Saprospiraceae bacterium]
MDSFAGVFFDSLGDDFNWSGVKSLENDYKFNKVFPASYWLVFSVKNESSKDTLELFFKDYTFKSPDRIILYSKIGSEVQKRKAGPFIPFQQLAFKENFKLIPLKIPPSTEVEYKIKVQRFIIENPLSYQFGLVGKEREKIESAQWYAFRQPSNIFHFVFFSVVGFFLMFSSIQFFALKEKYILFYGGYLLLVLMFYMSSYSYFEIFWRSGFKYISNWFYHLEVPLAYTAYIFYILFVDEFLDLKEKVPKYSKICKNMAWIFFFLIIFHTFLIFLFGINLNFQVYQWTRVIFFITAGLFIGGLFKLDKSIYSRLILGGTLILVFGAIFSLMDDFFGGALISSANDVWGYWYPENKDYYIPFYKYKTGILIEILFFSTAISLKSSKIKSDFKDSKEETRKLEKERNEIQNKVLEILNPNESNLLPENNSFLKNLMKELECNYDNEEFSTQILAKQLNLDRTQLYRKVKLYAGKSPSDLLLEFRLQKAKELLLTDLSLSIKEIAFRTGFKNPSHFSKAFKKHFGSSPSENLGV